MGWVSELCKTFPGSILLEGSWKHFLLHGSGHNSSYDIGVVARFIVKPENQRKDPWKNFCYHAICDLKCSGRCGLEMDVQPKFWNNQQLHESAEFACIAISHQSKMVDALACFYECMVVGRI